MQRNIWQKCLISAVGLCLAAQPLIGADDMSSNKNMMANPMMHQMSQDITESDLLKQMDEKDKAIYQSLSSGGKALMLKMVNMTKMNNNPMMMMQKCMTMMEMMMSKMDMMEKQNMMNKQKK